MLDVLFEYDEEGNLCEAKSYGKDILKNIKKEMPSLPVLMLTSTAREAKEEFLISDGIIQKPSNVSDKLFYESIFSEVSFLVDTNRSNWDERLGMVVGKNSKMIEIAKTIIRLAKYRRAQVILVTGATGTGKEMVCNAIRKEAGLTTKFDSRLVVHCGEIEPRDFNIKLGGFPKQYKAENIVGVLELLEENNWRGVLMIDEVDDLNWESQNILNRLLEGQGFAQENNSKRVFIAGPHCRFVLTAQKNLSQLVKDKTFREDLFMRINAYHIHLPPLCERKEIIPDLFDHFIHKHTQDRFFDPFLRDDVKDKLEELDYPGNIRQFENLIKRAVCNTSNSPLQSNDISAEENYSESNLIKLKKDQVVSDILKGYWKGEDKLKELFKEIRKTSKTMKEIMLECIERRKKELKRSLKHQDMAALFYISEGNARKWITVDLEIDWKEVSKYRPPES